MNPIPCIKCLQLESNLYHGLSEMMDAEMELLIDFERDGDYKSVWVQKQNVEKLRDHAHKIGWDGHHYKPMDNLTYVEYCGRQKNLI